MTQYTFYWTNLSFTHQTWAFAHGETLEIGPGATKEQTATYKTGAVIRVVVNDLAKATLTLKEGQWEIDAPEYFTYSELEQLITLSCNYSSDIAA